jgi:hypothetical protein
MRTFSERIVAASFDASLLGDERGAPDRDTGGAPRPALVRAAGDSPG